MAWVEVRSNPSFLIAGSLMLITEGISLVFASFEIGTALRNLKMETVNIYKLRSMDTDIRIWDMDMGHIIF